MPVSKIPRRRVAFTLPLAAYRQLTLLAKEEKNTVSGYVRRLVIHELEEHGLPIYCQEPPGTPPG